MPSLIQNYEYDIFVSYRHNDNRSGWVREFVHHLREELAATLKEPVSIYFDENPHDGLRETDLVDDSLREKVRCIIFIPIISQTYCDKKSFAWQNEFLVFKKLASEDKVGLKVKLFNGNTTSRILPIKIHDLDADDKNLLEEELGGVLRSIDFIFRSTGVNRPLRAHEEHSHDNLNKTFYRDQINKVANCIKETIGSLSGTNPSASSQPGYPVRTVNPSARKKFAVIGGIILSLMIASFLSYLFFQPPPEPLDKSIAVLAFDDLSQNHDQEYFSDGISEEIINALAKIEGLKVPSRTSSFRFKGKDLDLKDIGQKLNVALILVGSVRKSGDNLRIAAQLIDAKNGYHLWSETYNRNIKDIFKAQDEATRDIVKQLQMRLGVPGTLVERKRPTQNLEAYDLYLKGHQEFLLKGEHVLKAQELLTEAVRLDPNFAMAHAALAEAYSVPDIGFSKPREAIISANRALAIDSTLSSAYAVIAWIHSNPRYLAILILPGIPTLIHSNFERAIKLDPQNSTARLWYGVDIVAFWAFSAIH